MRNLIIIFLTIFVLAQEINAQSWQWARRGGGTSDNNGDLDGVQGMVIDKNGNTYSLVTFDGGNFRSISIDNNIPANDSQIAVMGGKDVGIISYNSCGKLRWYKVIGTTGNDVPQNIGIDSAGSIYVSFNTHYYNVNISNDTLLTNTNFRIIGLVKYDSLGNYKWVRQPESDTINLGHSRTYSSYTDKSGETYIMCYFGTTGLVPYSNNLVINQKGYYLLKYNNIGIPKDLVKLDIIDSISLVAAQILKLSADKILLTFGFNFIGGKPLAYAWGNRIKHDFLFACINSAGQLQWRFENRDSSNQGVLQAYWSERDKKIYIAGELRSIDSLNGFAVKNHSGYLGDNLPLAGCIDTLGNNVWMRNGYMKKHTGYMYMGTQTPDGKIYVTADITGTVEWGNNSFGTYIYNHPNHLLALNPLNGDIITKDSVAGNDLIGLLAYTADSSNNVYCGGAMLSDVFVAGQQLISVGGQDFFIAKYGTTNCWVTPLHFLDYILRPKSDNTSLIESYWKTANEINVSHFYVQRSTNGKDFNIIGKVAANGVGDNEYSFIDNSPLSTVDSRPLTYYYRIVSVDKDGTQGFSEIKTINYKPQTVNGFSLFPNPVLLSCRISIQCKGMKEVRVDDCLGRIVFQSTVNCQLLTVNTKNFNKGLYIVQVVTDKGEVKTQKLVIE